MSSWELLQYSYGFGISRIRSGVPAEIQSFWDSSVETRNTRQVILPPLPVMCSMNPSQAYVANLIQDDQQNLYVWSVPNGSQVAYHRFMAPSGNVFGSLGKQNIAMLNQLSRNDFLTSENKWGVVFEIIDGATRRWCARSVASINTAIAAPTASAFLANDKRVAASPHAEFSNGLYYFARFVRVSQ